MKTFVDTNVLAYLYDEAEPEKQKIAQQQLSVHSDAHFVVSTQVLQELYVCLTRGSDAIASPSVAQRAVTAASQLQVIQIDVPMVLEAIEFCQKHQLSFWDGLIVLAANVAGCDVLLTEDLNHGQSFGQVTIVNPFAA